MSNLVKRDLDGAYFRVERGGKWKNICFTDLTDEEIETVIGDRGKEWWKSMAMHLREQIRFIGDQLDLYMGDEDD